MASLSDLKRALRQEANAVPTSLRQPLTQSQYSIAFDNLLHGSRSKTYQDFIIPQFTELLTPLFRSRSCISVLEIGPGGKSLFEHLPGRLRQKIQQYTAYEPNLVFNKRLQDSLCSTIAPADAEHPFPRLDERPIIHETSFTLERNGDTIEKDTYDVILFCHSMYGLKPHHSFIEKALGMLSEQPDDGMVIVFHNESPLDLETMVCRRTTPFEAGTVSVVDDDEALDRFASFMAGFSIHDIVDKTLQNNWRKLCHKMGRSEEAYPKRLVFSSPNIMMAFDRNATTLPKLLSQVPVEDGQFHVKNREAHRNRPAAVLKPTQIQHVQQCVRWALKHGVSLTVVGGGHSAHCLQPNVASVDMSAFDQIYTLSPGTKGEETSSGPGPCVVVESGCKTGDIVCKTMAAGLAVPLGSRPSVGAGLWLQGGIGHLARLQGLSCDAIVGAVIVSVKTGDVFCIGHVPSQHQPVGAIRPEDEEELLWAIKGAGTNFGIVLSVTFKAVAAPTYLVRNWKTPLSNGAEAQSRLSKFDRLIASKLPRTCSTDAYLYSDASKLCIGVTMYESSKTTFASMGSMSTVINQELGPPDETKVVDGVGLFETEMYVSAMHGGHGGGKTSSFKRCLFLKNISRTSVAKRLITVIEHRSSPLCYIHLLQGEGAVRDVRPDATAFGCRDWDFACVITGVWPRSQDGTGTARAAIQWVYQVVEDLLPLSGGVYGADLGPDPRDASLAAKAFGPNRPRLAGAKRRFDPQNVLAYACPILRTPLNEKLIILVTGKTGAGKDHCAKVWAEALRKHPRKTTVGIASISDGTKRKYAAATGADTSLLFLNRAYKEEHRPRMTAFFLEQLQQRPKLLEENFLDVVNDATDEDVLLITGMREEAPVATFSHLVPESRLVEVYVQTSNDTRRSRRGVDDEESHDGWPPTTLTYRPNLIFDNNVPGNEAVQAFAKQHLFPRIHGDILELSNMVRSISDFPRSGIEFRHILGIAQQPGGLPLCTSLLESHFTGDWSKVDAVVSCEVGGFIFASALASRVNKPLVLIREAGKLPPPTVSVAKARSYISSSAGGELKNSYIEMERDVLPSGASVVVIDDVFSTGETLCAVLQLLGEVGVGPKVYAFTVAEFPFHRGRDLLRRRGFGMVNVQSLMVFGSS